jgi:hypothetical protein
MNNTTFVNFKAFDYNNVETLSTFCVDITPLLFVADIPSNYPHRIVWDFGDDTTSKNLSANKIYKYPGIYVVSLIIYDCNTNALISNVTNEIIVHNLIPFTFNITFGNRQYIYLLTEDGFTIVDENGDNIVTDLDFIKLKNGQFSDSIVINSYYPNYQPPSSIFYTISNENGLSYWDIVDNKFSHLELHHSLYEKIYNYHTINYQFKPIDKININTNEIYAKISEGSIVYCDKNDIGSTFVGISGTKTVYIKDDSVVDNATIKFKFDNKNNYIHNTNNYINAPYLNNLGIDFNYTVVENNDVDKLSISSNGLDGEYYSISSFDIGNVKYYNSRIPFVIKIKDFLNTSAKNFDAIDLSALNFKVFYSQENYPILPLSSIIPLTPIYDYNIYSLSNTLSTQSSNGAFRGYIEFKNNIDNYLNSVWFNVSGSFISNDSVVYNLSAQSNKFGVYPNNLFDVWKKNEDFNPKQTLMDLRFQETLLDKNILFEDFLGSLLGDDNSNHEAIGVKIYEKISNFASNTQDIETCELDFLTSLSDFVGYREKEEERYNYPEKIKKIIDLASINKTKLTGISNKFAQNLDIKGRTSKTEYGINIGDEIDPDTYTVNPFIPIVALEKFSNVYSVINTFQPGNLAEADILMDSNGNIITDQYGNYITTTNIISLSTYPLSTYSYDWGWPLVLPNDFQFSDMSKYYLFFDYVAQYDNTIIGGIIDFENPRTTVDYIDVSTDTFQHMFMDTIYQTLSLIN